MRKYQWLRDEDIEAIMEICVCYCPCCLEGDRLLIHNLILLANHIVRDAMLEERNIQIARIKRAGGN